MNASGYDFLIVGAGIFGVSSALELRQRGYQVGILNPDTIPHPLAASTDISKAVRMEYGSDLEYLQMAAKSIDRWNQWNKQLDHEVYHEVGFLLLSPDPVDGEVNSFEFACWDSLNAQGWEPQKLDEALIGERFPAFNQHHYRYGIYNEIGGYAESGKAVESLLSLAKAQGVNVHEHATVSELIINEGRALGVKTLEGEEFKADHIIICAGNFTPYLLPELQPYFRVTGHPLFHLAPERPEQFMASNFPVFGADIANSGWYGFPYHPHQEVVKIGRHSQGLELHPQHDPRIVSQQDLDELRKFLKLAMPQLATSPIVNTKLCCYTDTLDGHFWIDRHPQMQGLSVGSGGSGHGFKMAPVLGEMIADVATTGAHQWSDRYRWRDLPRETEQQEEARYKPSY